MTTIELEDKGGLGAEVVNAAGLAFEEIAGLVNHVSVQVKEISLTIDQMAIGSQQIVGSVNQIDSLSKKVTEETQTFQRPLRSNRCLWKKLLLSLLWQSMLPTRRVTISMAQSRHIYR
ncbi:hypothetical protein [Desulfosporosinus sp. I2]|uniref:hypothetical protein n=1 Tax=Desulfosporosinus sp. I2 TaxID=1617025 RepID=UPI0005EF88E7|nr:hypothetical protein [Desulfosporosinus sp. I2]